MVLLMSKVPTISLIFDKNKDGNYTSKALLYQDIIRYSILLSKKGKTSIKIWDLTGWLIDNNIEFLNSRKELSNRNKSKSNLIIDKIDTIRRKVSGLCVLELMVELGESKQTKGEGPVKLYAYAFTGFLLAWIMACNNIANRNYCENQIYELWQVKLEKVNSPMDIFTSIIFKKYKENGVFGEFVVEPIIRMLNSGSHIETMTDVIRSIESLHTSDWGKGQLFVDLWQQTWDELEIQVRQELLHHCKSNIELEMSSQAYQPKKYEEHRFSLRNDLEVLAMEALCRNCGTYNYASVPLVPYLRRKKIPQSGPKIAICAECHTQNVEIPSL